MQVAVEGSYYVSFRLLLKIDSVRTLPAANDLAELREPLVAVTILSPADYAGSLISLCEERGASDGETSFLGADRATLRYTLPLAEVPPWPIFRIAVGRNDMLRGAAEATTLPKIRVLDLATAPPLAFASIRMVNST